jgi:hypothetical protein
MVGTARTHGARAQRGENGPGRGRRSTHRASSDASGIGDALALLSTLVAAVTLLAKTLEKAIEPLADLAVVGKGMVARKGDAAGGAPRPPRGAGGLPPGGVPPAAAKAARCSPARRARNARRAKAFYSPKGDRPAGDGEPAPARPAEGGLVLRHPSRWPRRLARRRHRRRHPASRRRRQQRRLHLRLLRFQLPARASRRCACACARALVLGAPSNPVNRRRTSGRCPTPPCASLGRLCDHARARPMRVSNSLPTSIGPSWT